MKNKLHDISNALVVALSSRLKHSAQSIYVEQERDGVSMKFVVEFNGIRFEEPLDYAMFFTKNNTELENYLGTVLDRMLLKINKAQVSNG